MYLAFMDAIYHIIGPRILIKSAQFDAHCCLYLAMKYTVSGVSNSDFAAFQPDALYICSCKMSSQAIVALHLVILAKLASVNIEPPHSPGPGLDSIIYRNDKTKFHATTRLLLKKAGCFNTSS